MRNTADQYPGGRNELLKPPLLTVPEILGGVEHNCRHPGARSGSIGRKPDSGKKHLAIVTAAVTLHDRSQTLTRYGNSRKVGEEIANGLSHQLSRRKVKQPMGRTVRKQHRAIRIGGQNCCRTTLDENPDLLFGLPAQITLLLYLPHVLECNAAIFGFLRHKQAGA